MEVVLVKRTLPNGLASPETVQLERKLRASSYWSHLQNKRGSLFSTADDFANMETPALLLRDGDDTKVFTDVPSFERFSRAEQKISPHLEAACW